MQEGVRHWLFLSATSRKVTVTRSPCGTKKRQREEIILHFLFVFSIELVNSSGEKHCKLLVKGRKRKGFCLFVCSAVWEMNKKTTNANDKNKKNIQIISVANSWENSEQIVVAGTEARKSLDKYDGGASRGFNTLLRGITFPDKEDQNRSLLLASWKEVQMLSKHIRQFILFGEPSLGILMIVRWGVAIA